MNSSRPLVRRSRGVCASMSGPRRGDRGRLRRRPAVRRSASRAPGRAVRQRRSGFGAADLRRFPPRRGAARRGAARGARCAGCRRRAGGRAARAGVDGRGHRGGDVRRARRNVVEPHRRPDGRPAGRRRRCRRPPTVAVAVRTRPGRARLGRAGTGRARIGRREHLRRARGAGVVGRGRRGARGAGLPRRQHAGRDDREPLAAICPIRLGCSTFRRCRQFRRGPRHGPAGGGVRAAVGGSPAEALRAWRRDAARHPSPNAGVVEAAFAGALGVRLGGPTQYAHELEIRPTLGDGRAPGGLRSRAGGAVVASRAGRGAVVAVCLSAAGRSGRRASPRS